jgi:hypothetical protein
MTPFLNDIGIHGGLVLNVVPELPARSSLFSVMAAWYYTLLASWAWEVISWGKF